MNRKLIVVLMLGAFVSLPLLAAGGGADAAPIYKAKCVICHGADGKGETPTGKKMKVRDLAAPEVQKMTDAEMTKIIADGKAKMPAYKAKLSAAEIEALVGFMRTFKK
jgi:cytochrome c6